MISSQCELTIKQDAPFLLDVSFTLKQGKSLVIYGASGSGKTTILRILAGLHRWQSAQLQVFGEVWEDRQNKVFVPAFKRSVGFVFQDYALFPHLTALQNIAIAAKDNDHEAMQLLTRIGLQSLAGRYPQQLSGGQKQRVALLRAIIRRPALLLLDEPFSAVDTMTRLELRKELAELRHNYAQAMILVTHDWAEASELGDEVLVLESGRILQIGSPQEIFSHPVSMQVARLTGSLRS